MSAEFGRRFVLKQLLLAARNFEAVAAKHGKAEPARQALREAMTGVELVLSVEERPALTSGKQRHELRR